MNRFSEKQTFVKLQSKTNKIRFEHFRIIRLPLFKADILPKIVAEQVVINT